MSIANVAFLILVIAAFTLYGVALFIAWLTVSVFGDRAEARSAPPASATPVDEHRQAA